MAKKTSPKPDVNLLEEYINSKPKTNPPLIVPKKKKGNK